MRALRVALCGSLMVLGAAFLSPAPASAQATANFQGRCSWNATFTQFTCTFNAQRPASAPSACPGSFIWKYRWDFDDGTSSGLISSATYTRSFPGSTDPLVTLNVLCWDGNTPQKTRMVCAHFCVPGGILINGTYN